MKLSVQGLNSYYGPAHILFDVALEVGVVDLVEGDGLNVGHCGSGVRLGCSD